MLFGVILGIRTEIQEYMLNLDAFVWNTPNTGQINRIIQPNQRFDQASPGVFFANLAEAMGSSGYSAEEAGIVPGGGKM